MSQVLGVLLVLVFSFHGLGQDTRAKVQGNRHGFHQRGRCRRHRHPAQRKHRCSGTATNQPVGQYLFDFVLPGNYTVTVELTGFKQFVQQNVLVQARGDVTVNAVLEVGNTRETVTVEASPVAVQFNTTTMALTLDTKMANSLPIIHRNPFLLVALNPATVVRSTNEQSPFHHWAANAVRCRRQYEHQERHHSGRRALDDHAEIELHAAHGCGAGSEPPAERRGCRVRPQRRRRHQRADEIGHQRVPRHRLLPGAQPGPQRAGGPHHARQEPDAPARLGRHHGNPIKRNKLFNFFSYEGWRTIEPKSVLYTMPTDLERNGDFSRSLKREGGLANHLRSLDHTDQGQRRSRGSRLPAT